MEENKVSTEAFIDEEKAELPVAEAKPDDSTEVKQAEEEFQKVAPISEGEALKTKSASKKWLIAALFIAVNVLAILLTAVMEFIGDEHPINVFKVLGTFAENWVWGLGALILVALSLFFEAGKRFVFLQSTIKKNKPITSMNAAIIVKYYDSITPLGGGGQPFEIYYLRKKGLPIGIASGIPLVSYALNKIAYVFVSLIALMIYGFGEVGIFIKVLCLVGLSINLVIPTAIVMFALMPRFSSGVARLISKVGKKLRLVKNQQEFYEKMTGSFTEYAECIKYFLHKSKISIIVGFICSIGYFVALYSLPYFTIRMSGVHDVNWGRIFTYCVICYASITLLPTPGGSGGAELSFRSIFESYLSGGILFWSMLSWRIFSYYIYIFLGLGLIIYQQVIKLAKHEGKKKKKEVEIKPEDELDLYTPIPATMETAEDDINTAVPLTVAEATLEPDVEPDEVLPEILEAEPEELVSVAEFTAVIESKSTVTITEERIELQEKPVEEEHQISIDELLGESYASQERSSITSIEELANLNSSSSQDAVIIIPEQSTTEQPTVEQSMTEQPTAEEVKAEQPTAEQPSAEQSMTQHTTTEQPKTELSTIEVSSVEQSTTEHPSAEEVKAEQPVEESNLKESSTIQQDLEENLLVEQSTTEQPTVEQSSAEQPTVEQPSAEQSMTEQTTTEQPKKELSTIEVSSVEQSTVEQPTVEQSTAEQPTVEQSMTQYTTTEQPVEENNTDVEKPAETDGENE